MPDNVDAAIAQGVQVKPPDLIGSLSGLAQFQYAAANAQRAQAEAQNFGAQGEWLRQKNAAAALFQQQVAAGKPPQQALIDTGYATYLGQDVKPVLESIQGARDINTIAGGDPSNPASYAVKGANPAIYQTAAKTKSELATAALERHKGDAVLLGQLGGMLVTDPSDAGFNRAVTLARVYFKDRPEAAQVEQQIEQLAKASPADRINAGRTYQTQGMSAEKQLELAKPEIIPAGSGIAQTPQGAAMYGLPGAMNTSQPGALPSFAQPNATAGSGASAVPSPAQGGAPRAPAPTTQGGAPPPVIPGTPPAQPAAAPRAAGSMSPYQSMLAANVQKYPGGWSDGGARMNWFEGKYDNNVTSGKNGKYVGSPQGDTNWYGKFGNPGMSPYDPRNQADATGREGQAYARLLTHVLGRAPTDGEIYIVHQQGEGGGPALLTHPNERAGDVVGDLAIRANRGNPDWTAKQFTDWMQARYNGATPGTPVIGGGQRQLGSFVPGAGTPGYTPPALPPTTPPFFSPEAGAQPTPPSANAPPEPKKNEPGPPVPVPPVPAAAEAPKPGEPPAQAPTPAPVRSEIPADEPTLKDPTGGSIGGVVAASRNPLQVNTPGGGVFTPPISPQQLEIQKSSGEKLVGQFTAMGEDARNALKANAEAENLKLTLNGSWNPGTWADKTLEVKKAGQAVANMLGFETSKELQNSIASQEAFHKDTGVLVRLGARETGSNRVGVRELQFIAGSSASQGTSEQGLRIILAQAQGLNDYAVAMHLGASNWNDNSGGNSIGPAAQGKPGFQAVWESHVTPAVFVMQRMYKENPQAFAEMKDNMLKQPGGKEFLANMQKEHAWLSDPRNGGLMEP